MALLWLDGFESFGDTTGSAPAPATIIVDKYNSVSGEPSMTVETGRNGTGKSINLVGSNNSFIKLFLVTSDKTSIIGFAFKYETIDMGSSDLVLLYAGAAFSHRIWFDGLGTLQVRDGSENVMGTADITLKPNKWYWIEYKVYIDNTAGTIEMRVGNATVLSVTGIDTDFQAVKSIKGVGFRDKVGSNIHIDDFYICDGAGSDNNDFLGNGFIETIRPNSDNDTEWGALGAGSHYIEVDESESDELGSYVYSSTADQVDTYGYSNVSGFSSIDGVIIISTVSQDAAGTEDIQNVIKSGTTTAFSDTYTLDSTLFRSKYSFTVVEQDPDASAAWTPTSVNAALFGIKYI